jgi:RimJ/RimL family protein N-acetyltransferase
MSIILETIRLVLRHFTVADAQFMLRLVNEPSWIQFIGDRKVYTIEDAENYLLNGSLKSYQENGFGFYPVLLKGSETIIGTCGFAKRPFLDYPDFGFAFLPEYTGMGYATEIAVATLAYAEEVLKIETVFAYATKDNIRSIKLLSKTGFMFDQYIQVDDEQLLLFKAALHFVDKDEDEGEVD